MFMFSVFFLASITSRVGVPRGWVRDRPKDRMGAGVGLPQVGFGRNPAPLTHVPWRRRAFRLPISGFRCAAPSTGAAVSILVHICLASRGFRDV